jgi:hypothetical protein
MCSGDFSLRLLHCAPVEMTGLDVSDLPMLSDFSLRLLYWVMVEMTGTDVAQLHIKLSTFAPRKFI